MLYSFLKPYNNQKKVGSFPKMYSVLIKLLRPILIMTITISYFLFPPLFFTKPASFWMDYKCIPSLSLSHRQYKKWTEPSHWNSIETSEARFKKKFFFSTSIPDTQTQTKLDDVDVTWATRLSSSGCGMRNLNHSLPKHAEAESVSRSCPWARSRRNFC